MNDNPTNVKTAANPPAIEVVASDGEAGGQLLTVVRLRVPGGWLYSHIARSGVDIVMTTTFVPEPRPE